jgi:hypothetical protein
MTKTQQLVKSLFKDEENNPFLLTEGQDQIFSAIFQRKYPRLFITTWTQFGKSDCVSMAVLARIASLPDKFTIVAPTTKKAQIITGYLIGHIFDNPVTKQAFQIEKGESAERIQRERNKSHLTFKTPTGIGEVLTLSAEGRRTKDIINTMLGFGSKNVIIDESPTLSPEHYTSILRMLGGHKDNMLVEIGNAINRNHFYKAGRDPNYHKIVINYEQGMREGRQTKEFFDEMRRKMPPQLFASLYECKFPSADAIDSDGYSPLITEEEIDRALVDELQIFGELRLGVDIAYGGENHTVAVVRGANGAKKVLDSTSSDTMATVGAIMRLIQIYKVTPQNVFIDVGGGSGKGVYDRLREELLKVTAYKGGETAENKDDFYNKRTECYWRAAQDIKSLKLKLVRGANWDELMHIKYKLQSDRKIKLMPKEDLLAKGFMSPDTADALIMTYGRKSREDTGQFEELTPQEIAHLTNLY